MRYALKTVIGAGVLLSAVTGCYNTPQNTDSMESEQDSIALPPPEAAEESVVEIIPPLLPEDILLTKEFLYDKYTLEDVYPYQDTTRSFKWEAIRSSLAFVENVQQNPTRWVVMQNYKKVLHEIARVYNEAMNIIHYMHDKYYYEKAQMAFVDTDPRINLAYGVAGLSIALDSLSAIKYAKVTPRRNEMGLTESFDIQGEFPCFGNNDDRVDHLGVDLVYYFSEELKKLPVYKNARPTLSLLTITSNVMYGKKTGATPDGRAKGVAFAPGANPMHGRDKSGAIASLSSVAKLRYRDSQDGISNTFSIVPKSLGPTPEERVENLVTMLDGYFTKGAHHLNVNVLNREMLEDAMEHPEKYPQLTIRVSGYAVNFTKLSREHQLEVISRSFHERM